MQTTSRVFALAVLLAALTAPVVSAAQSSQPGTPAAPPAAKAPASAPAPGNAPAAQPAAAPAVAVTPLEPQGYTYDPQGRRDPFVSLLRRGSEVPRIAGSNRPNGLAGLETSEVTVAPDPVTTYFPSLLNPTQVMPLSWPWKISSFFPSVASHRIAAFWRLRRARATS